MTVDKRAAQNPDGFNLFRGRCFSPHDSLDFVCMSRNGVSQLNFLLYPYDLRKYSKTPTKFPKFSKKGMIL